MSDVLEFKSSEPLTVGVELELQLVDRRDGDLTRGASDLLALVEKRHPRLDIKLEITESMIEVATGVQRSYSGVLADLRELRDAVCSGAALLNVGVCGGGAHPFQVWTERHIAEGPRMRYISELYGYLAKQFTVFGQHVHIGCANADAAVRLVHGLSVYVPHFIALAASSPFSHGTDTAFDCSRMNTVASFPLSGRMPFVRDWGEFNEYFHKMQSTGIVSSMKDFYWDIRPKPEYGTVEVRVFDTPLTVERAAALAIYAQSVAREILARPAIELCEDPYLVYGYNRFQACRFGLQGEIVDPSTRERRLLVDDIRATLDAIGLQSRPDDEAALREIAQCVDAGNDATWLRKRYAETGSMGSVVGLQLERFAGGS